MRLPATTYRYGRNQDRRGSNANVSPHCFTVHPVMGGETYHYAHLTAHCLSLVTLEEGYDKARIPQSRGFDLIRPASTRLRPSLDAQRSSTGKEGRHGTVLRVISPSHLRCRHGAQGWPAIPGARRYRHSYRDRQKHHLKAPSALASSYPIKKAGQDPTRGHGQQARHQFKAQCQTIQDSQRRDQHLKQSSLYFFPFETWARRPLSQACNPYASTSVQGNTKLSPPCWT
jgi:hypothetical protein